MGEQPWRRAERGMDQFMAHTQRRHRATDVDPEKGEVCLQSWEDNRHVGEGGGR